MKAVPSHTHGRICAGVNIPPQASKDASISASSTARTTATTHRTHVAHCGATARRCQRKNGEPAEDDGGDEEEPAAHAAAAARAARTSSAMADGSVVGE